MGQRQGLSFFIIIKDKVEIVLFSIDINDFFLFLINWIQNKKAPFPFFW